VLITPADITLLHSTLLNTGKTLHCINHTPDHKIFGKMCMNYVVKFYIT